MIAEVEVVEQTTRTLDGPFGRHRIELKTRLTGSLQGGPWHRETLGATLDGSPRPNAQGRGLERRSMGMLGPEFRSLFRMAQLPRRRIGRLQPIGPLQEDERDGKATWRLEAAPRNPDTPLERVTLWFSPAGHLVHSRMIMRKRGSLLISTVDYMRLQGLDVPRARNIEGTLQTKRRMRTFSTLFTLEATYDAYRFTRADAQ